VTPLYPQKLALTSPTGGGGRSVGIVRSRTKATEFSFSLVLKQSSVDGGNDVLLLENGLQNYVKSYVIASREINPVETVGFLCSLLFSQSIHIIHYINFAIFPRDWFLGYLRTLFQPCRLYRVEYQQGWNLKDGVLQRERSSKISRFEYQPVHRLSWLSWFFRVLPDKFRDFLYHAKIVSFTILCNSSQSYKRCDAKYNQHKHCKGFGRMRR